MPKFHDIHTRKWILIAEKSSRIGVTVFPVIDFQRDVCIREYRRDSKPLMELFFKTGKCQFLCLCRDFREGQIGPLYQQISVFIVRYRNCGRIVPLIGSSPVTVRCVFSIPYCQNDQISRINGNGKVRLRNDVVIDLVFNVQRSLFRILNADNLVVIGSFK